MDEELGRQSHPQCCDCRHGQQTDQNQLGGVVERRELSPDACPRGCQLDEVILKFVSQRSLQKNRKDERTVKWRAREPALKYGSFMTAAINKNGHARIIIMRPGDHSPLEAEYIFADCLSSNRIPLTLGRRTIHISTARWNNPADPYVEQLRRPRRKGIPS